MRQYYLRADLRQLHTSEDDGSESHRPYQWVINFVFVAGVVFLANILYYFVHLACGNANRRDDVPLAYVCAVIGICLFAVLVWLGVTQVHW